MSNYDREYFAALGQRIIVGAEVVNGTGEVLFEFSDDVDQERVIFVMPHEQAMDFALFIMRKVQKAWSVQLGH